jgi:single-stranded-DNA-specific exonuclease
LDVSRSLAVPVSIRRRREQSATGRLSEDLHPLLSRLYRARGVHSINGCSLPLSALHPFELLQDIELAADLLAQCIREGGSVLVVGDYDADGATGSALAVRGLGTMGAAKVSYLVPSRFAFGYGLSPAVVEAATPFGADLILTVDNGISSLAGVRRANELGISVIVTDHHLPGSELPTAAAIVNPNRSGDGFPSKSLAGVGVVFYLLAAVRARLRELSWLGRGRPVPNLAQWLDLVALGTVADVVTLDENNRILVEQGLRRIRAGRGSPGVSALLRVAGRDPAKATSRDLAFAVGPRLNAAGRLTEMSLGVECLLADDPRSALSMARELDALNRRRRAIEGEMKDQAEAVLADLSLETSGLPPSLCLFGDDWHQGVIGILAARVRERYHRPVIAFAPADGGMLRGSARSIDGLHIRDLIDAVDKRRPGLIARFGGHAMAAGLSLHARALDAFREAFVEEARRALGDTPPVRELLSDGELPAEAMDLDTAEMLRTAGPWGKGFPEPLFDGRFQVLDQRIVGERHLKMRLRLPGSEPIEAIGFCQSDMSASACEQAHLAYRLDVNEFRGTRSAQLIVEHLEWKDPGPD